MIGQGLGEELSRQATWTLENFQYIDDREGGDFCGKGDYSFSPSGTLNPFSHYGKCEAESCMAESTNDFIKSVGLYSEIAALPDPLSGLLAYDSISEAETNERLLRKLKVLGKVAPLVRSGLLKFGTPILRNLPKKTFALVLLTLPIASANNQPRSGEIFRKL